jgi:hypothetical protein
MLKKSATTVAISIDPHVFSDELEAITALFIHNITARLILHSITALIILHKR